MNKVIFPLVLQMKRAQVADLHDALILVGSTIADSEKTNGRYGATTRAAVLHFQRQNGLAATGDVDAATATAINAELTKHGLLDPQPSDASQSTQVPAPELQPFSIEGEVVKPDGTPLPNLVIRAYDRTLCEWRLLGEPEAVVRTNDFGRYTFGYGPTQLKRWGKSRADLKVEVLDSATADKVLAESPLILQAQPHETVNFSIGKERFRGLDEFTRVERALAPLLGKHEGDLSCVTTGDVLILAREAKMSPPRVAHFVKAQRWSRSFGVPAAVFYALMRRGEPTRIDALVARPLARLWARLEEARSRNVIGLPLDAALRQQLALLQHSYLAQPTHPYSKLLGTTALDAGQSAAFTRRLAAGEDLGDAFWRDLADEEGFSAELVTDLQAAFELQHFVGDNTSLSLRLRGDLGIRVAREVAAFSVDDWRDKVLADSVDLPDTSPRSGTAAERRASYALMLYRGAEARWATPSLAGQMARDPVWAESPVLAFLSDNPDFEFNDQRAQSFLRANPKALDSEQARNDLLRVEQLFHLTEPEDKLATIQAMWSAGLRAASQVAGIGRNQLARRLGPGVDARSVQRIFRKAVHTTSLALSVYLRFNPRLNRLSTPALTLPQAPGVPSARMAMAQSAITLPEWEELFGSADACDCPHDESALGAAAYLVDQMAFLEKAVDAAGHNALDELLARRPDLGALQLTTENTQTLLPHIDAVIEILEAIVASADGKTLPATAFGPTSWDADLLAAQPQYLNPAAYDIVRESRYPIQHLPFDLWAEEGRRYLAAMGIARHELMQTLPAHSGVGELEIANEALGMSSAESKLIRHPRTQATDLALSWGIDLARGTLSAQLATVEAVLAQAQIDYDTFLRMLNTRYINPARLIAVRFAGAPCSLDGAVLVDSSGATLRDKPLREWLDRLHRFMRLQRRLAASEYELDTLLAALGVAEFDAAGFFPDLADAQTVRQALKLSWVELAAWSSDLDTYVFEDELPSSYEAVFVNDAMFPDIQAGGGPDLRNDVFALRSDRTDLVITTSTSLSPWLAESDGAATPVYALQPDYAAYVQSATRLSADDLLLLVQNWLPKDGASGHVALNLVNLSMIYRIASLARAYGFGVRDALRLFTIVGIVPLKTANEAAGPAETRAFHNLFVELEAGSQSIEALAYLLLQEADAAGTLAPLATELDAWLLAASVGFVGIAATDDVRITDALKSTLTQSLASALGIDAAVLEALLFTHRPTIGDELLTHAIVAANPGSAGLPPLLSDLGTLCGLIHKFGLAWSGLALDAGFLAFVVDQGPALGWADIAALPMEPQADTDYAAWRRLVAAAALQNSTFSLQTSMFGLLADAAAASAAQAEDPTSFVRADQLAQISAATGWALADVTYLTGPSGFNLDLPAAMRDEQGLVALKAVFDLLRSTGVAAEQAHAWTIAELGFAEAQTIRQALSLAFSPERWLDVLGPIQDGLRTLKRDALLGHALTHLGLEDSEAFYRHYLLDPDVAPTERTSRIVLAHSAVQLFAQRILLNLETFKFERADAQAWQWRARYRVWEAARKVFLWPENWLEPEWRDNKSAFFEAFEDGLLQDDVTHETAERLYTDYLHKLNDVSRLEIAGFYSEAASETQVAVLHVFGRSQDVPRRYYYRRWEDESVWTPWEPVELDIDADHLIPIVSSGRLYLFWPEFTQTDNPNPTTVVSVEYDPEQADAIRAEIAGHQQRIDEIDLLLIPNFKGDVEALEDERAAHVSAISDLNGQLEALTDATETVLSDKYLMEVGLKWSEYRDGRWSATQVSGDTLSYSTSNGLSRHYFTGWVDSDKVMRISARINLIGTGEGVDEVRSSEGYIGYFYFNECGADLVASHAWVTDPEAELSAGTLPAFHAAAWYGTSWSTGSLELELRASGEKRLLVDAAPATLVYAHQDGQYGNESSPFFFCDGSRTYMVRLSSDIALASGLDRVLVADSVGQRSASSRSPTARSARLASSIPTTSTSATSASAQHFESHDTGLVMSHSASGLCTSSLATTVGSMIAADPDPVVVAGTSTIGSSSSYVFTRFYHPYTCMFLEQQYRYGVDGVLDPDPAWGDDSAELQRQLMPTKTFDFEATYNANSDWVADNFGSEQISEKIDFDHGSPFGSYHWELFFHIPLLVARRLMQNQRYADARRWFHYIFDPTSTDGVGSERFWKIKPFYLEQLDGPLASLDTLLADGNFDYEKQLEAWELDPFNVHAIARLRISAYMQTVVMRYIQCLIEEADLLFRRDTREEIDAARQLYLLANEILGERPTLLPEQEVVSSTPNLLLQRFRLEWNGLPGGNPLDALIHNLPTGLPGPDSRLPSGARAAPQLTVDTSVQSISGLPTMSTQGGTSTVDTLLLFCLPHNEMLYELWHTVADRLFKIRHSMNFSGVVRQLALFAPPIDPALLVRASAAGLSIEDIVSGLFAPRSCYRFAFLLQKALELCNEARSLGAAMLAALEKRDGEQLALLRSTHEVALLESISSIKKKNVDEAKASLASLVKSRESAEFRAAYYTGLERISSGEQKSLDKQEGSRHWQTAAEAAEVLASVLHAIPTATSTGPQFGGPHLGSAAQAVAGGLRSRSAHLAYVAGTASTMAGYGRRFKDWRFQADLARKEIAQLDQQLIAAEIRQQVAEADLENHALQIAQSQATEEFLELKFSRQQLYSWMVAKLAAVHFGAYQMAYQMALQAEAAFKQELGPDEQSMAFIKFDNWESLQKGLLAGELLSHQLRQMEVAHMAANKRELEISKHVSLFQLDPEALLSLRQTGQCDFHVPELAFDLDFAGHFYRRIKTVQITIPCVVGPYTSVSSTLNLTASWTRRSTDLASQDEPVLDALPLQTAIATGSANQAGGAFELNFNDPRYLPFEGAGVISSWHLELPESLRPFDYATISDVVMHVSYTARDGGPELKSSVSAGLRASLNDQTPMVAAGKRMSRLFSLRYEFSSAWSQLMALTEASSRSCTLQLSKLHFPSFLDHEWSSLNGEPPTAMPITLVTKSLVAHLSPKAVVPSNADQILLNQQLGTLAGLGIPTFDLTNAPDTLSSKNFANDDLVTCELTLGGSVESTAWDDLYLVLEYEVTT